MLWSLLAGCGLALVLLVTGAEGQSFGRCQTHGQNDVCLGCVPPLVIRGGFCQSPSASTPSCPANCAACPRNNTICDVCNPGFRLKDGECERCLAPNCKVCHATCIDRCEECLDGFRRNEDYKCERCNGLCRNCTTSAASCDECGPATYADSSATCGACSDTLRCEVCSSPSICVQCKSGNFLSGSTCSGCTGGCLSCTSATNCNQCPANQYWNNPSGGTPSCTACHAQCKTNKCDLRNKCTECNDGYFLSSGTCIQRTNCKTPLADGKCDVCNDNFKKVAGNCVPCLDLTSKECHMCVEGNRGRLWKDGQCDYCPANCNKCNSTTDCQSCRSNYVWNTTTSTCDACPTADSSLTNAQCALCSTSYWDSSCKACPGADPSGADQSGCENCNSVAWTQNCTSCTDVSSRAEAECQQCAAAKTGIWWNAGASGGAACEQYNCSNKNSVGACDACGVSNLLVQCRACPSDSSQLTMNECEQCDNFKWVGSACIDTNSIVCTGNLVSNDEATCLYCGSHYYDNSTGACKVCTGTLDATSCPKCPGRYWTGSVCDTMTPQACSSAAATTPEAMCNACNVYGKYYNGSDCIATDCSSTPATEQLCNACDGFMYDGTNCVSATAGDITGEEACSYYSGRTWNGSMCLSIIAMAGQTIDSAVASGNVQLPPLYQNLGTTEYAPAVCNEFDTVEECSRCTGQYWDGTKCKAVDCTNPTTANDCNACPKRYYSSSTCETVPACSTSLASQAECEACRFDNYYWDTTCKQSSCDMSMLTGSAGESECQACEGVYWNGAQCLAATSGNFTHSEEICEGFFARVFVNSACLFVTSKVGDTIDQAIQARNPFVIMGDRYFDDNGLIMRQRDPTAPYEIAENWCRYGASKYGLNRYWAAIALDSDCINVAATPNPDLCSTSTAAVNFRASNPTLCGKCPGYRWDTTTLTCNALACNMPSSITTQDDCQACGQGFVWENYVRSGSRCKQLTCSSDLLGSAERCSACSVQGSPKYLQSTSACYACPAANCLRCDVQGCTKCNEGFVLDTTAGTCTACTGSQVFDPATQTCKTCPSNCRLCSSASVCTECQDGFILRGDACVSCVQTEADCNFCKSTVNGRGSRWDASASLPQCIACPASCAECTASGCTRCLDGFYEDGNTCRSCKAPKLIADPNGKDQCERCFTETYFAAGSGCVDCLVENCEACSASEKCSKCTEGRYFKTSTMKCELCTTINSNCLTCTNAGDCATCGGGTYVSRDKKSCVSQDANCITHRNEAGCTQCKDGFYISGPTCTPCQTGCAKCTDGSTCTMCEANYFMTPLRTCARCIDNCDVCECNAKCDKCATGYCFDVNNLECITNTKNCKDCTKDGAGVVSCINCADNFVKDVCPACTDSNCIQCNAANTCQKCRTGYRLDSNTCTACTDSNCAKCDATVSTCEMCKDNYFDSNSTCTQCGLNCKSCFNATSCNECFGGYTLSGGACTPCTPSCAICRPECQVCAEQAYAPDPIYKQCVLQTTTAPPPTTPSNSPPSHRMALATLVTALILLTMTII